MDMFEGWCKQRVISGAMGFHTHRCERKIWKDGFCKQHHPNSVEARRKEMDKRYEEKQKRSPYVLLAKSIERERKWKKLVRDLLDFIPEGWDMPLGWNQIAAKARKKVGK
jgi:hypothetical protein